MQGIFGGVTFTNAFIWITFAPIATYTKTYYGVTDFWVNMLSVSFMVLYLPGSLFSVSEPALPLG